MIQGLEHAAYDLERGSGSRARCMDALFPRHENQGKECPISGNIVTPREPVHSEHTRAVV